VCNIHLTLTDLNDAVWQQQWSPASSDFKVNKQMLLASIEEETKRDLAKAEKYHSKQTYDKATKVACESNLPGFFRPSHSLQAICNCQVLRHAVRLRLLAEQIAAHGRIVDFAAANQDPIAIAPPAETHDSASQQTSAAGQSAWHMFAGPQLERCAASLQRLQKLCHK